jgi:hypothetical protein
MLLWRIVSLDRPDLAVADVCAIAFETAGWPMRSCRAAPENEPVSIKRTNASMADKRSMVILQ